MHAQFGGMPRSPDPYPISTASAEGFRVPKIATRACVSVRSAAFRPCLLTQIGYTPLLVIRAVEVTTDLP